MWWDKPPIDSTPTGETPMRLIRSPMAGRFGRWLDERIPPSSRVVLSQSNIFIFPTRLGFVFGGLLILLIFGAINYQASLVYAVAFLLGSVFLVTILYTFRNLSSLTLELTSARPGFVGEDIEFSVRVARPAGRAREGVLLGWPATLRQSPNLDDAEADILRIYVKGVRRGILDPGRLLVETHFPLGLLRAWTWVDLNARAVVYPKPIFGDLPIGQYGQRDDGELIDPRGSEDFTDIKSYQPGDPIKHILWRSYARTDQLMVKHYASYVEPRMWLSFDEMPGGLEEKVSRLTGLALKAHRSENEFGMRLGTISVEPGVGEVHLERVLKELAVYGLA